MIFTTSENCEHANVMLSYRNFNLKSQTSRKYLSSKGFWLTKVWEPSIIEGISHLCLNILFCCSAKMIMYEMPWIMNGELWLAHEKSKHIFVMMSGPAVSFVITFFCVAAAWKIVKTWLGPEALSKLKFVNKSDIQTYVGPEHLLTTHGRNSTYK